MAKEQNDLKKYLQTESEPDQDQIEDQIEEQAEDQPSADDQEKDIIEQEREEERALSEESSKPKSSRIRKLHFWSDWSKNKKIAVFGGGAAGLILLTSLLLVFVVRPGNAGSYITKSWYEVVASSASIDRAVEAEVNLEGTRDLTKELYAYNQKLSAISFESSQKNSLTYNTSTTNQYSDLTEEMGVYYSDAATILAKTDSDISSISASDLDSLKSKGSALKAKIDQFRTENGLQQELNPNLLALDVYVGNVKSKKEDIEKEKQAEEKKQADEAKAAAAKDIADKATVEAVANSYYKALVSGSEAGVRATLSKGYQSEYDFAALTAPRRASLYPKSYRVVTVAKDGDNYKLTASVTYVSVYQDGLGNNVESTYVANELYRVVYSTDTNSWKLDGRVDS